MKENKTAKLLATIIFCLLLFLTIFLDLNDFVDGKILSKWYGLIFPSFMGTCLILIYSYRPIAINRLTLVLITLWSYMVLRGTISGISILEVPIYITILALYLFFHASFQSYRIIEAFFLIGCLTQAIYALLQHTMILPTNHKFVILGSYGNPSGLATNLAVLFPFIFRFSKKAKWLSATFTFVILLTIILSGSRAGLISIMFISGYYFYYNIPDKFRSYKKHILFLLLFFGIVLGIVLFLVKVDSAVGRILIWHITCSLISDNFLFGGGDYVFSKDYMKYQANYFVQNPESNYVLLADNIMYPFNEYLLFLAKYGLVAGVLLVYGCILIVRSQRISSPYTLCLISIGIFSLFSYPFQYPITWIVLIYSMAQISKNNVQIWKSDIQPIWGKIIVMLFLCIGSFFLIKDVKFEYKWNKIAKKSLAGRTEDMLPYYDELYSNWNGNYLFLYNYAAELAQVKQYKKSLDILNKTVQYWSDYDIQLLYADNYMQLQNWNEAEIHLKLASNMCPNRFIPLFNLHKVYLNTNRKKEALDVAYLILNKKIKIPSATVYSIRGQMKRYIQTYMQKF